MQLCGIELREILIRRKGLLLLLVLMGFYGMLLWNEDSNRINDFYNHWKDSEILSFLDGPLDESSEAQIRGLLADYEAAAQRLEIEKSRYLSGELTQEEYQAAARPYVESLKNHRLIRVVRDSYEYVREDPENRYFVNPNGWTWLLNRKSVRVLCVLAVMLLLIPVFTTEAESGIHDLLRSCEQGCGKLFWVRIACGIMTAALCTLIAIGLELGIAGLRFGLAPWNSPIQSLAVYEHYEGELTIGAMFSRMAVCRLLGNVMLAVLCMVSSIVCKTAVNTFIAVGLIYFGPYFLLSETAVYQLPLPLALTEAFVYIRGYRSVETGKIIYMEISKIAGIYLAGLFITGGVLIFGWAVYHEKVRLPKRFLAAVSITGMIAVLLGGCGRVYFSGEYRVSPVVFRYLVGGDRYAVLTNESPYLLIDGETGQTEELFFDPFMDEEAYAEIVPMFWEGNELYYLRTSDGYESVWRLDCEKRENRKLCDLREAKPEGINLWGLQRDEGGREYDRYMEFLTQCQKFYFYQDRLYVLAGEGLIEYDCRGKRVGECIGDVADQSAFYQGRFYYQDSYGFLNVYDCGTREERKPAPFLVSEFAVGEKALFLINTEGELYRMSLDGEKAELLQTNVARLLYAEEEKIYYTREGNGRVCENSTGTEQELPLEAENLLQLWKCERGYVGIYWEPESRQYIWKVMDGK